MEKNKYDLSELLPYSALKVFILIDQVFKSDLNLSDFNSTFNSLSAKEQYFLCNYLNKYLDQSSINSGFTQWLMSIERKFYDAGEHIMFYEKKEELLQNRKNLLYLVSTLSEFSSKLYEFLSANKVEGIGNNKFLLNHREDYKIPLPIALKGFKENFISRLSVVMTRNEAEQFYNNSINFGKGIYPIKLLHIKPSNKSLLRSIIYELYLLYSDQPKMHIYEMQKAVDLYNKKFENNSKVKKRVSVKNPYIRPFKKDFVRVMYNAFPFLRINFHKYFNRVVLEFQDRKVHIEITPDFVMKNLKNYLDLEARNIKKALKTHN